MNFDGITRKDEKSDRDLRVVRQKKLMKRTVLVFGLIAGLIVTAMMLYSVSKCYTDETWEPSVTLG